MEAVLRNRVAEGLSRILGFSLRVPQIRFELSCYIERLSHVV
jgi:hypothetical protein